MGASSVHRRKGISDKEFFTNELLGESNKFTMIASNSHGSFSGEFYAAIRNNETEEVFGLIVLKTWAGGRSHDYFNFTYKSMDETSGPFYHEASQDVLDALTPTDNEHALKWREGVAKSLTKKRETSQLSIGDVIKFDTPVRFTNGEEVDTFRIGKHKTLSYETQFGTLQPVRFRGWKNRNFTVVG